MPWEIIDSEEYLTSTFKFKEIKKSNAGSIVKFKDIVIPSDEEHQEPKSSIELKDGTLKKDGTVIAKDVAKYYCDQDIVLCYSNGDLQIVGKPRIQKFCDLPVNNVYLIKDQIIVCYSESEVGSEAELYCVDTKNEKIYRPVDPASAFGAEIPNSYFFTHLSSSSEIEHILVVANKASTDIGTLCYKGGVWYNLVLDDGATIVMPMSDDSDSYPTQMEIEYSLNQVDGATPDSPKIQCSKIYVLNDKKELLEFYCVWNGLKEEDVLLKRLKSEKEVQEIKIQFEQSGKEDTVPKVKDPADKKTPTAKADAPGFGVTGFGSGATPSFGSTGFGSGATPSFGSTGFGSGTTPSFGSTGFGNTTTPAFGSTSFGQTGFGASIKSVDQLKDSKGFGSYSNANIGFGNTGSAFETSNKSAFATIENKPELAGGKPGLFGAAVPAKSDNSDTANENPAKSVFSFGKPAENAGADPLGLKSPTPTQNVPLCENGTSAAPVFSFGAEKKETTQPKSTFTFGKPAEKTETDPFGIKSPKQTQNTPLFGAEKKETTQPAFSFAAAVNKKETTKPSASSFGTVDKKKEDDPLGLKSPKSAQNVPLFGNLTKPAQPLFGLPSDAKPVATPTLFGSAVKGTTAVVNESKNTQPQLFGNNQEKKPTTIQNQNPVVQTKEKSNAALAFSSAKPTLAKSTATPKGEKKSARQILVDQFDKTYLDLERDFTTLNKFQQEVSNEIASLIDSNTPSLLKRDQDISELQVELAKVSLVTRSLLDREEFKNLLEILKSKKSECENRLNIINNHGTQKIELSRKLSPEAELLQQKITMKNEDIQAKLELAEHKINIARSEIEQKQVRVQPTLQSIYNTSKQLRRTISTLKSQLLEHQLVVDQFIPEVKDSTPKAPAPPKLKTKKSSYGLDDEMREADDSILKPPVTLKIDEKETLLKKEKIRVVLMNLLSEKKITVTEATVKESSLRTHKTIAQYRSEMESHAKQVKNDGEDDGEDDHDEQDDEYEEYDEQENDDDEGDEEEYEEFLNRETTPKRKSDSPHKTPGEYFAESEIQSKPDKTPEKVPFNFANSTPPSTFSFSTPQKNTSDTKAGPFGNTASPPKFSFAANVSAGWTCDSCLVPNKADATKCISCETAKPGAKVEKSASSAPTFSFNIPKTTDWTCDSCLVKNKPDASNCVSCESAKPGSKSTTKPEVKPNGGAFVMSGAPPPPAFSFANPKENNTETKPQPSAFVIPSGITAPAFAFNVPTSNMKKDSKPQPGAFVMPTIKPSTGYAFGVQKDETLESQKMVSKAKSASWTCETCLVPNQGDAVKCAACETAKPGGKSEEKPSTTNSAGKFSASKDSGWTCNACLVSNKADAVKCVACETAKPGANLETKSESKTTPAAFVMPGPSPPTFNFGTDKNDSNFESKQKPGAFVMPGAAVPAFSFVSPKAAKVKPVSELTPGSFTFYPTKTSEDKKVEEEEPTENTSEATSGLVKDSAEIDEKVDHISENAEVAKENEDVVEEPEGEQNEDVEKTSVVDETQNEEIEKGQGDQTVEELDNEEDVGQTEEQENLREEDNDESIPEQSIDAKDEKEETLEDSVVANEVTEAQIAEEDTDLDKQDISLEITDADQMEKDESVPDKPQANAPSEVPATGFGSFGFDTKPKNKVNPMFGNVESSTNKSTGFATTGGFGTQPTFSSFGNQKASAFGNTNSTTFGSTGFGSTSATSAFGDNGKSSFGNSSTAAFGNNSTSAFGNNTQSAFGNNSNNGSGGFSNTTQSTFGQSAFTTPTKTTAFGGTNNQQSAFGTPNQSSAFGSPGNQNTAFGNKANGNTAFGNTTNQPSAFGGNTQQSAFGNPTPAFGQSGFGSANTNTSFGQTGFGSPAKQTPTAFGQTAFSSPANGNPGFGQTGFGTPNAGNASFGQTGFGTPSFGSTGFGSVKPTGFANVTPTSFSGTAFASHTNQPVGFAAVPQTNSTGSFGGGGGFGGNNSFGNGAFGGNPSFGNPNLGGEKKNSFTGYRG
ncbi:hypothetical protein HDV06_006167 [Boothiomyces sp. JEL0866]|nr:hypothetical protein HDV06_006167 [Boothiomyces sp. JEL0866]